MRGGKGGREAAAAPQSRGALHKMAAPVAAAAARPSHTPHTLLHTHTRGRDTRVTGFVNFIYYFIYFYFLERGGGWGRVTRAAVSRRLGPRGFHCGPPARPPGDVTRPRPRLPLRLRGVRKWPPGSPAATRSVPHGLASPQAAPNASFLCFFFIFWPFSLFSR